MNDQEMQLAAAAEAAQADNAQQAEEAAKEELTRLKREAIKESRMANKVR